MLISAANVPSRSVKDVKSGASCAIERSASKQGISGCRLLESREPTRFAGMRNHSDSSERFGRRRGYSSERLHHG